MSDPLAEYLETSCESPIEHMLVTALVRRRTEQMSICAHMQDIEISLCKFPDVRLAVALQAEVKPYRFDILLGVRIDSVISWLVVECDGHDWHDRTKEQAAHDRSRDRALQRAGFDVFRFTGREIWRDGDKCADEIFQWVNYVRGASPDA